jgi:hypothetical protein
MALNQVFSEIPFSLLRPAHHYGRRAALAFAALASGVVLGQWGFPAGGTAQSAFFALGFAFFVDFLARTAGPFSRWLETRQIHPQLRRRVEAEELRRPNAESKLVSWVRSGDVLELEFDSGSWMLVRSDVNDRQWRDVQRLLVWCKRVPSRAVL